MSIEKFPVSSWKRVRNRRGRLSVSCVVSDRWLSFERPHDKRFNIGTPIKVDVMTDVSENGPRKLCQLIVTVEQLKDLMAEIDLKP